MEKKLLHFVFVFLLAICMTNLKSTCSFAYNTTITQFENDIKAKLNILKEKGVIASGFSYNNIGTPYDQYFDYILMLRPQDKQANGTYSKIFIGYWRRAKHNPIVNASYNNTWGYSDYYVYVKGFNTQNGALTDATWTPSLRSWTFDYVYTTIEIDTSNMTLGEGEEYGQYYITEPPSTFNFIFFDDSVTATAPNGETATCVFLNNLTDIQPIGYIENFEDHTNAQITIFMQNYRDVDNVKVEALQPSDYMLVNGELWVKTITMWSPMVYEIVGIDNGPSGDFLNGQNFITYYYIAAGSNTSGDPNFYGTPPGYDDNQFFLWKLLGSFGNGSGDPGSGILGGLGSLFVPDKDFFVNYFNTFDDWFSDHLGLLYTPFELVFDIIERINDVDFSDPQLSFGPFTLPLSDDAVLVPLTTINFNDFLEDEKFEEIHNIYLIIIDGLIVCGLLYMLYCKYEEIVGGKEQ